MLIFTTKDILIISQLTDRYTSPGVHSSWIWVGTCLYKGWSGNTYQFSKKEWPIHIPIIPGLGQILTITQTYSLDSKEWNFKFNPPCSDSKGQSKRLKFQSTKCEILIFLEWNFQSFHTMFPQYNPFRVILFCLLNLNTLQSPPPALVTPNENSTPCKLQSRTKSLTKPLRGYCTSYQKLVCFVLYLHIINNFSKNKVCIL